MYLHGSRTEFNIGQILVPGIEIGVKANGGKNDAVYMVMTSGFSLRDCEDGEYFSSTLDFAVSEAAWWAGDKFIYIVEPLDKVYYDGLHDSSPAAVKTSTAKILKSFKVSDFEGYSELSKTILGMSEDIYSKS